jgi:hypothetical protein
VGLDLITILFAQEARKDFAYKRMRSVADVKWVVVSECSGWMIFGT